MRARLVDRPIDGAAITAEVADTANGATVLFLGTVREVNQGRPVTGLEYSAYHAMAEREMLMVIEEAERRFHVSHLVVEHRVGALEIGDVSIAIAAAHPHRASAFDACRYVIEELKKRVPIWKREHYTDGAREWVDPSGAPAPVAQTPR